MECDKCGECCRHLNEFYSDLDRGDGVCKYLIGNLCSIYEKRPIKCNIDKFYDVYLKDKCSKEKYYELNSKYCKILKNRRK
ncbi:MAG: YkgJ family cysteine cluster protein [Armatimonadetes bacterium]|nr:YkgJ family cysteine cluster protein [Candidatus Hippobium faecium]